MQEKMNLSNMQSKLLENQNKLLEKMNDLIEQQNRILQSKTFTAPPPREIFVKDLDRDEMRDGFLVTSHKKKLWNVQIGLINEFARICKKYNLRWFACSGTLLGAARHKGFIPWDDDVDISMFRPDYERFKQVAAEEIKYPYFFDNWYNYRRESDKTPDSANEFPLITLQSEKKNFYGYFPSFPMIKIRDSRTTMIEIPDRKNVNQGIWIDIFPLDVIPSSGNPKEELNFGIAREILMATINPDLIRKAMEQHQKLLISYDDLKTFIKLPYRQRGMHFDNFMLNIFSKTRNVGIIFDYMLSNRKSMVFECNRLEKTVYLPFEQIEVPVPKQWEYCLKVEYGDWTKLVYSPGHTRDFLYSAEIPYTDFYKTSILG